MNRTLLWLTKFVLLLSLIGCNDQFIPEPVSIIPAPQQLAFGDGYFVGSGSVPTSFEEIDGLNLSIDTLSSLAMGGYRLNVSEEEIQIISTNEIGQFYAFQTLRQAIQVTDDGWIIPEMTITDYPKFQHRGLLLDCSRHFFSVDVIKKYIDLLAYYKMNVLHWHLTEDQGWRIAIDKYPKLTEISAWRTEKDGTRYGGFYTKEEIKEVVAYAAERHVTIIPEIEMPGHSQAALAAYPEFSCKGSDIQVANDWGVFKEVYCAGNEATFQFLEGVLTEVMELFPSEYIHIGGDEAPKFRWEHCAKCQQRIQDEGLHDEHELQSYFIQRIENFLNANGRKLIGWDEIMEGGLSPNATVQSWRGMEHGRNAAKAGHDVVFSPTSHSYLDYDLKSIDLAKVYAFDPLVGLEESHHKRVIGAEVNMWTEHVPDEATLDSKVFPRLLAMAEVAWTYKQDRNFDEFFGRVQSQYPTLNEMGVQYGLEGHPASISLSDNRIPHIKLEAGVPNLTLSYSIDSKNWTLYKEAIPVDFSGLLSVRADRNGKQYGEVIEQEVDAHLALGQVPIQTPYSEYYTAGGDLGLLDGLLGSLDFRDGRWQGFYGEHFEAIVDLGSSQSISSISTNFYQYNNSWIFLPKSVTYSYSSDGETWIDLKTLTPEAEPKRREKFIESFGNEMSENVSARFVKVQAENILKVPDWHEAAGSKAWLFIDEIAVK